MNVFHVPYHHNFHTPYTLNPKPSGPTATNEQPALTAVTSQRSGLREAPRTSGRWAAPVEEPEEGSVSGSDGEASNHEAEDLSDADEPHDSYGKLAYLTKCDDMGLNPVSQVLKYPKP